MITDKLGSYGAAEKEIMLNVEHRQHNAVSNDIPNWSFRKPGAA
ncbi:transposase-like protein [Azospirillum canadense]|nr:transposase-like protein [Azospirillum canadense]